VPVEWFWYALQLRCLRTLSHTAEVCNYIQEQCFEIFFKLLNHSSLLELPLENDVYHQLPNHSSLVELPLMNDGYKYFQLPRS